MDSPNIFVHAHCFYPDIWPEVAVCIRNVRQATAGRVDVFVTYPETNSELRRVIRDSLPDVACVPVENRGYDVAPFFKVLNEAELGDYDYIVKLHTKRDLDSSWVNFRCLRGDAWRRLLLSFCRTPQAIEQSLSAFERNPLLGMIGSRALIDPVGCGAAYDLTGPGKILRDLGLTPRARTVLYGTMFMMRARLLRPAWRKVRYEDFSLIQPGLEHNELGLAGAWEGAFGMMTTAQGHYVSDGVFSQWLDRPLLALKGSAFRCLRKMSSFIRHICGADYCPRRTAMDSVSAG